MNIRKRLLLISSLTFGVAFTISALLIYSIFFQRSENIIFKELENTALLTAYFYLEKDEMSQGEHNQIRIALDEQIQLSKVKIFNEKNDFVYGDALNEMHLTAAVMDQVRQQKKIYFKQENTYYYGFYYPDNQGNFVVFAFSENEFFASQIHQLLAILGLSLLIGFLMILLLSYYLTKVAYAPIEQIIEQIETSDFQFQQKIQLHVPESQDEIQKLTVKFNELFGRIAETFAIQKNFTNYVSHEIKTPLASIAGTMEVFAQKERSAEEYKNVSEIALKNVAEIENTLNNLLLLTNLENPSDVVETYRLDEQIWHILSKIQSHYPTFAQPIQFDIQIEKHEFLTIYANKGQLEIALYNLIENAVKFSNRKAVHIVLKDENQQLQLSIQDQGIGIPAEEIRNIQQAFYRASNVKNIQGSGVGLSLALLIFQQNKIDFQIHSTENIGTQIKLLFPKPTH
ncbi:MAG TPA: HAMP domain-containing sensor histidine kinase [Moheibacter sp.]|nr:HAMP domain-containing sensor histidine kinase [Moheibacter sp.]